jgi:hypothetical protein
MNANAYHNGRVLAAATHVIAEDERLAMEEAEDVLPCQIVKGCKEPAVLGTQSCGCRMHGLQESGAMLRIYCDDENWEAFALELVDLERYRKGKP